LRNIGFYFSAFLKPLFYLPKSASKTKNGLTFNIYLINFQLVNLVRQGPFCGPTRTFLEEVGFLSVIAEAAIQSVLLPFRILAKNEQSMTKKPEASDQYYANQAKWNIQSVVRGVGKSLDIPKWHEWKTPISIVHYDAIPDNADAELSQAILVDRKRVPLDELVADKPGKELWQVKCLKKQLLMRVSENIESSLTKIWHIDFCNRF